MDYIQDYIPFLARYMPAYIYSPLITATSTLLGVYKALSSHFMPLITRIMTKPDVASIIALVIILLVSLQVLNMAYRAVMFWVRLALRLFIWGTAVALTVWIYNRGMDGFMEDVEDLAMYWTGEYAKFKDEAKVYKQVEEAQMKVKASRQKRLRTGRY